MEINVRQWHSHPHTRSAQHDSNMMFFKILEVLTVAFTCRTARSCFPSEKVDLNDKSNFSMTKFRMRSRLRSRRGPNATTLRYAECEV